MVELVVTVSLATWFCDKSHGIVLLVMVREVASKLWVRVYSWAALSTANLVPAVAVPWLIVRSPASVVERLPIVPVVEFSVPIVPSVELIKPENVPVELLRSPLNVPPVIVAVEEVRDWMVPLVILAPVAVALANVAAVPVVVPRVALLIVPVVIVALVLTVRLPVAVP